MSHLSILPTVLKDADLLAATLLECGYQPCWGGVLSDFGTAGLPVLLQVQLPGEQPIGWQRQSDGSLALVGDLQRLSRSQAIPKLLATITRAYAARLALQEVSVQLPQALVTLRR
ncbi:MAG: DUF1257 domain-containing protein [Prochlorococcaceae cyanobacterium]